MTDLRKAAIAYAKAGWPVFPCAEGEKWPLTKRGVKDATTNLAKVERYWQEHPNANIGLHPGAIDMMVLDYDRGSNPEKAAAKYDVPPTGLVAKTPRSGMHEYFTLPPNAKVPPSASKIATKVDVRSHHSYVLLPPSRTKDGTYEWLDRGTPAPAPQKLIEAACEGTRERADNPKKVNVPQDLPHNQEAFIEWVKKEAKIAVEGQGGNNCLTATAAMGHSYALTPETTTAILWDYYNGRCVPPWDDLDDFSKTCFSGHRSASSEQGNMTEDYRRLKVKQRHEATRKLFEERRKEAEATGDLLPEQPNTSRFKVWTIPELKRREPPKWIIDGAIPEKGCTILYGSPGTFKTFIALDMALCIATDTEWFGRKVCRGRVLYTMGEGSFDADKRIEAWKRHHNAVTPVHDFKVIEPAPLLRFTKDVNDFLEAASSHGPWDVVVIDTIGRTMPGINDNAAEGARLFSELVTAIRTELGAATMAITHAPKDRPDVLLGSGAFEADADVIFNAICPPGAHQGIRVNFRQKKNKYAELWNEGLGLERVKVGGSIALKECPPMRDDQIESAMTREIAVKYIVAVLRSRAGTEWSITAIAEGARERGCQMAMHTLRTGVLGKKGWGKDHSELKKYWHHPSESWRTPSMLPDLDPAYDLSKQG